MKIRLHVLKLLNTYRLTNIQTDGQNYLIGARKGCERSFKK